MTCKTYVKCFKKRKDKGLAVDRMRCVHSDPQLTEITHTRHATLKK